MILRFGQTAEHLEAVFAFFIGAFSQCGLYQTDARLPKHFLHHRAQRVGQKQIRFAPEQVVPLAPGGKILAAVHEAGLIVGQGYGPENIPAAVQCAEEGGQDAGNFSRTPVRKDDIKIKNLPIGLAAGIAPGGSGIFFQALVPVFALFISTEYRTLSALIRTGSFWTSSSESA